MHVSGEIRLRAKLGDVWRYITDPEHFADYVQGWDRGGAVGAIRTGEGARYEWTAKLGPLSLRTSEHVTEWREPERVAYEGEMAGVGFRSSMSLVPIEDDTRLRIDIDCDVPPRHGGRLAEAVLRPLLRSSVRASLERLADRYGACTPPVADHGLSGAEVIELYRKRARSYDRAIWLYQMAGFDIPRYRALAADALHLEPGDTVVEIGCGTGANLPYLRERVGPEGRVVGVDLTDAMLERARAKVVEHGWSNVELVQSDGADYRFPDRVDGVVSFLALTLSPRFDDVIAAGARALSPGGRWVVFDLKYPSAWPAWLLRLAVVTMRPYGVSLAVSDRHPWESLRAHLPHSGVEDRYFGAAYLAWGQKG